MRMFLATLALACGWYALASDDTSDRHPDADAVKLVSGNHGTAFDLSPLGQTATVGAGATFPSRVIDCNGASNAHVTFPDHSGLETVPFSISCWIRIDAYTSFRAIASDVSVSGTYEGWHFYYGPGISRGLAFGQTDSSVLPVVTNYKQTWTATGTLSAGTWYHVGVSLDALGNTPILYINGAAVATSTVGAGTISSLDNPDPFRIGGKGGPDFTNYHDGAIDDLRIVRKVLSAAQFATLYYEGLGVSRP